MDREKVKTGIFEMLQRNTWKDIDKERHRFQPVLNDALVLLKEYQEKQEGLPPAWQDRTQEHVCQKCGGIVWQEDNYCSKCGQKVKWNA